MGLDLVALEHGLLLVRKRGIGAVVILGHHANGLGLGLGFNGLLYRHGPLLVQHGFGDAIGKGGAAGQFVGQRQGVVHHGLGGHRRL